VAPPGPGQILQHEWQLWLMHARQAKRNQSVEQVRMLVPVAHYSCRYHVSDETDTLIYTVQRNLPFWCCWLLHCMLFAARSALYGTVATAHLC
jgi:hypothetical protein